MPQTTTRTLALDLDPATTPPGAAVDHLAELIGNAVEAQRRYLAALEADDGWEHAEAIRDRIACELASALARNMARPRAD